MELLTLLAFALITLTAYVLLKQYKPELALCVVCSGCAVLFLWTLTSVLNAVFSLRDMLTSSGVDSTYFLIAFKALGVCGITRFVADTCRDFGSAALEEKVSFAGKCAIFVISLPLLKRVAETVSALMN